jgi:hypothetical protein
MAGGSETKHGAQSFIRAYGLFWRADQVRWSPGTGPFRILGRVGQNKGTLRVCDFRDQRGIYVLYDDFGPYYVGLAHYQAIGDRLKAHAVTDQHRNKWDRFSWFGFRSVLAATNGDGTRRLGVVPKQLLTESKQTISDIEALLIQSLGTQHRGNKQQMQFHSAVKWLQIMDYETEIFLAKAAK